MGIPLVAAIPFDAQHTKWPHEAQTRYQKIINKAEKVINVAPGKYAAWKFIRRDEWMVDNAACVVALWDGGEKGGTWHTVNYARKLGKDIINLYDNFSNTRS